ncbi:hypothetical protein Tco_1162369, partial [Tanacetum coccineum]
MGLDISLKRRPQHKGTCRHKLPQPGKGLPTSTSSKAWVILPQLLGRKGITLLP